MKYEEVIKLLNEGFTVDEIREMEKAPEEAPEDPKPEVAPEEAPAENANELVSAISEVKEMFSDLRKEIQAMNIMNSKIDIPEPNADDLIANIINPFSRDDK